MKFTILITASLLLAHCKAEQLLSQCKDVRGEAHRLNESYIGPDNCNKCRCIESGNACTRRICPRDATPRNAEADRCVDKAGVLYDVGQTYTHVDGCNTCRCTEHGGACTRRFCIQEQERQVQVCRDPRGTEMKQGDSWIDSDGCNKCLCGALGAVCTEKACGQHNQFDDGDAHIDEVVYNQQGSKTEAVGNQQCRDHRNQPRQPGETWLTEDSCNVCSCKGDGSVPSCTKMGCRVRLARLLRSTENSSNSPSAAALMTLIPLMAARLLA